MEPMLIDLESYIEVCPFDVESMLCMYRENHIKHVCILTKNNKLLFQFKMDPTVNVCWRCFDHIVDSTDVYQLWCEWLEFDRSNSPLPVGHSVESMYGSYNKNRTVVC